MLKSNFFRKHKKKFEKLFWNMPWNMPWNWPWLFHSYYITVSLINMGRPDKGKAA